jgi:hypothetical protein
MPILRQQDVERRKNAQFERHRMLEKQILEADKKMDELQLEEHKKFVAKANEEKKKREAEEE